MAIRRRTWMGVGVFALAGTSLATAPAAALSSGASVQMLRLNSAPAAPIDRMLDNALRLAQGGEGGGEGGAGGEGGEGGEAGEGKVPESYALPANGGSAVRYHAKAEIAAYANGVHANYVAAAAQAKKLQAAVTALLADPTDETLAAARRAWTEARPAYLVTEAYRFYDGPIEDIEGRINAWPVDESFIDYVVGKPDSGLINDLSVPITIAKIDALDQKADEDQVATGWHAIEFLLWGQDLDPNGPGNRPVGDYFAGKGNDDRRRTYLEAVTAQLVADLDELAGDWAPGDTTNYAASFLKLPEREALGRILNGVAVLAGSELMSERMAVGLDSGDQEHEQSCFSDTTHQDFVYDVKGIVDVWFGAYAGATGPSLDGLMNRVDPALAEEVRGLLDDTTAKVAVLGDPWDKVLASPADSLARARGEAAVAALGLLADGFKRAGAKLGVLVQIPAAK